MRHGGIECIVSYLPLRFQAVMKTHALDRQIRFKRLQLTRQRHRLALIGFQCEAQKVAEASNHRACSSRIGQRQRGDRVERVEQEMRLQLHAQGVQLRLRQLPFKLRAAQAFALQAALKIRSTQHRQYDPVSDQVQMELINELDPKQLAQ